MAARYAPAGSDKRTKIIRQKSGRSQGKIKGFFKLARGLAATHVWTLRRSLHAPREYRSGAAETAVGRQKASGEFTFNAQI